MCRKRGRTPGTAAERRTRVHPNRPRSCKLGPCCRDDFFIRFMSPMPSTSLMPPPTEVRVVSPSAISPQTFAPIPSHSSGECSAMIRDPRTRDDLLGAPGERRPIGGGDGGAVFEDLRDPEFVIKIFHGPRASGIDGVDGIDFIRAAVEHEAEMFNRFYGACSAEAFFTRDDDLCLRMRRVPGKPMNKVWPSEYGESKREILEALDTMQAQLVEVGVTHGDLHSANVHFDAQARRFWPVDLGAASVFAWLRMGPDAPTPGPLASDDSHIMSLQARVSALMDSHVPEVDEVHAPLFELVHWQSCGWRRGAARFLPIRRMRRTSTSCCSPSASRILHRASTRGRGHNASGSAPGPSALRRDDALAQPGEFRVVPSRGDAGIVWRARERHVTTGARPSGWGCLSRCGTATAGRRVPRSRRRRTLFPAPPALRETPRTTRRGPSFAGRSSRRP